MKLDNIKLKNFRCFGEKEQVISCNDFTALIGNNSSGKTSALKALALLFSDNPNERVLQRTDFFVPIDKTPDSVDKQELYVEAVFSFKELESGSEKELMSVPPFFESFAIDGPNDSLYLRIRLEAVWQKDSSAEGAIESNTYFITCSEGIEIQDSNRKNARRLDLNRIRMIYIPAVRDPSRQLKNISGTMMYQIMSSVNWSDEIKENINSTIDTLNAEYLKEKGVSILKDSIRGKWINYDSDARYSEAKLQFNSTDIDSAVKQSEVVFSPAPSGKEYSIDEMGDGLRSLFYISMVDSILDVENTIRKERAISDNNLSFNKIPPILTIVAIEEPENHIAPHLIGQLITKLNDISQKENSQIIISSHSPAIIKRISPEDLRYFRLASETLSTVVKAITLPDKEKYSEQFKYIKEAVKAYPELYFAELVVLGEGDSEELILRRFFELGGGNIDSSGISIVPLGGRHVNHFWRLLSDLKIPYITLLDLDREREGGGWGRIEYVLKQLLKNGTSRKSLLQTDKGILTDEKLEEMKNWNVMDTKIMQGWIDSLERYEVFFSSPLDIDFLMLETYGQIYKSLLGKSEGPRISVQNDDQSKSMKRIADMETVSPSPCEYSKRVKADVKNTLKACGTDGSTYSNEQQQLMVWYNYFFLNRGKPSTHIGALSQLSDSQLKNQEPEVIKRLIEHANKILNPLN
jgi:predicted ATP-dependent endonuclease of OLD family